MPPKLPTELMQLSQGQSAFHHPVLNLSSSEDRENNNEMSHASLYSGNDQEGFIEGKSHRSEGSDTGARAHANGIDPLPFPTHTNTARALVKETLQATRSCSDHHSSR